MTLMEAAVTATHDIKKNKQKSPTKLRQNPLHKQPTPNTCPLLAPPIKNRRVMAGPKDQLG